MTRPLASQIHDLFASPITDTEGLDARLNAAVSGALSEIALNCGSSLELVAALVRVVEERVADEIAAAQDAGLDGEVMNLFGDAAGHISAIRTILRQIDPDACA